MLNDYQKRLIAEGFYSRLVGESNIQSRILMILELMDSCIPNELPSTIPFPTISDGIKVGPAVLPYEWNKCTSLTTTNKRGDVDCQL